MRTKGGKLFLFRVRRRIFCLGSWLILVYEAGYFTTEQKSQQTP